MPQSSHAVESPEQLRSLYGTPRQAQQTKANAHLDTHCRRWIAASPFLIIGSADATGHMDLSPKGDPAGFVHIIDDQTLAVPDRPGNNRLDTFTNVLANPQVSLIFLVPGRGETLRVEGTATITTDPDLLAHMTERGRPPIVALVVTIRAVMFHCGKSMIRSAMWRPDEWPAIDHLASYAECLGDQANSDEPVPEMETRFATWVEGNELY